MSQTINTLKKALEWKKSSIGFSYTISVKDIENVIKEYEKLQDKIDKAIEYIKENAWYMYKDNEEILDRVDVKELLEILGDKENE